MWDIKVIKNLMWSGTKILNLLSDVEFCVDAVKSRPIIRCALIYPGKLFLEMLFKLLFNTLHDFILLHVCSSVSSTLDLVLLSLVLLIGGILLKGLKT